MRFKLTFSTTPFPGFVVREIARRAGVPVQEFVVRNDCPCGTTIGPIIAAKVGIRTADVGIPSLSMVRDKLRLSHAERATIRVDYSSHAERLCKD